MTSHTFSVIGPSGMVSPQAQGCRKQRLHALCILEPVYDLFAVAQYAKKGSAKRLLQLLRLYARSEQRRNAFLCLALQVEASKALFLDKNPRRAGNPIAVFAVHCILWAFNATAWK
ncbi:hypothetical protein [Lampropedia aestuarii]|uniref:hypothetical protein n=1 Tax=Lampropedia aestuarii TaxID=2562762 RepID=UPI002469C354|nr:hypothetical protein [Lampropedia aestuarii]MDH5856390.1 hypothetical protein [Lampropedia aestuarii]